MLQVKIWHIGYGSKAYFANFIIDLETGNCNNIGKFTLMRLL